MHERMLGLRRWVCVLRVLCVHASARLCLTRSVTTRAAMRAVTARSSVAPLLPLSATAGARDPTAMRPQHQDQQQQQQQHHLHLHQQQHQQQQQQQQQEEDVMACFAGEIRPTASSGQAEKHANPRQWNTTQQRTSLMSPRRCSITHSRFAHRVLSAGTARPLPTSALSLTSQGL